MARPFRARCGGDSSSSVAHARAQPLEARIAAIVAFGQQVIAAPAEIDDAQVDALRALGYSDEQLAEVVGLVSLQLLTGAFNLLAGLEPDDGDRHAPALV
ncbi:MAG TPA: hypothetical protein VGV67_12160 [Solirubrobacteraceae bacterium]|nr:hypothetical protein [Solirubrobacteraceae bacterium]